MSDPGPVPELAWLPVDKLDVDPAYQRSLDMPASRRLIAKIAAEFDWMKFQALLATPRRGSNPQRWLLIDGQHRNAAVKQRGDITDVPALVFAEASQAEQAAAFVGANKDRVAVSAQALFHARLVAGDKDCALIKRYCDAAGIELLRYNLSGAKLPAGKTAAAPTLLQALKLFGEAPTAGAVASLGATFARFHGGLRNAFFFAAARFLYEGGTHEALERALTQIGVDKLDAAGAGIHGRGARRAKFEAIRAAASIIDKLPECRAKAGDSVSSGRMETGIDPAGRPAGGRTSAATEVGGRDSRERPAPSSKATPLKRAPLPRAMRPRPAAQPGDDDAIARFLAEKGARVVMSPEQVAAFLRDSGHNCTIQIATQATGNDQKYLNEPRPMLDGKPVPLAELYQLCNSLRAAEGLKPIAMPEKARAA